MGVIYKLTNKITSECYIGKTTRDFNIRLMEYEKLKCKTQPLLYTALKYFGFDNFQKEILEQSNDIKELDIMEKYYINFYHSYEFGYNLNKGGGGVKNHSLDTKRKMSLSKIGSKNHRFGKSAVRAKSILCIQLNKKFNNSVEASKFLNIDQGTIIKHLKGHRKHVGDKFGNKYTFTYI